LHACNGVVVPADDKGSSEEQTAFVTKVGCPIACPIDGDEYIFLGGFWSVD